MMSWIVAIVLIVCALDLVYVMVCLGKDVFSEHHPSIFGRVARVIFVLSVAALLILVGTAVLYVLRHSPLGK